MSAPMTRAHHNGFHEDQKYYTNNQSASELLRRLSRIMFLALIGRGASFLMQIEPRKSLLHISVKLNDVIAPIGLCSKHRAFVLAISRKYLRHMEGYFT